MQNVMHISTNAGHTKQNDGHTMHNVGRNTLNVYQGAKGVPPLPLNFSVYIEMIFRSLGTKKIKNWKLMEDLPMIYQRFSDIKLISIAAYPPYLIMTQTFMTKLS